ncbi:shock factor protein 4 [Seminavis robusta]|uniref:Shock factor protein 4 n=1 Tax=Seminavis robusta TaxID=568900 RepID=A0A9N8DNE9_9STRA|nr:shock factor protein 4 [Seminavis robusta]|eukprot:Sro234_g094550.1 shock factor protein 4 (451) ;mRNA; r:72746-74207
MMMMSDNDFQAKIRALLPANPDPNASFPMMLYKMLADIEELAQKHPEMKRLRKIVRWLDHGMAFKVYDRKRFISIVMPTWFIRLKHTSWIRQLNLYGFDRIQEGPDKGAIYHEKFLRGQPDLARGMEKPKRQKVPKAASSDQKPHLKAQFSGGKQQAGQKKDATVASPASAPSLLDLRDPQLQGQGPAPAGLHGYLASCGVTFGQSGAGHQTMQFPIASVVTTPGGIPALLVPLAAAPNAAGMFSAPTSYMMGHHQALAPGRDQFVSAPSPSMQYPFAMTSAGNTLPVSSAMLPHPPQNNVARSASINMSEQTPPVPAAAAASNNNNTESTNDNSQFNLQFPHFSSDFQSLLQEPLFQPQENDQIGLDINMASENFFDMEPMPFSQEPLAGEPMPLSLQGGEEKQGEPLLSFSQVQEPTQGDNSQGQEPSQQSNSFQPEGGFSESTFNPF